MNKRAIFHQLHVANSLSQAFSGPQPALQKKAMGTITTTTTTTTNDDVDNDKDEEKEEEDDDDDDHNNNNNNNNNNNKKVHIYFVQETHTRSQSDVARSTEQISWEQDAMTLHYCIFPTSKKAAGPMRGDDDDHQSSLSSSSWCFKFLAH